MRNIKDAMGDALTGKQVLVVDDLEMLRASVQGVRGLAYVAVEAENGVEVMETVSVRHWVE